ncbi:hypothetical protein GCM10027406_36940 [Leifsonia lichenia]
MAQAEAERLLAWVKENNPQIVDVHLPTLHVTVRAGDGKAVVFRLSPEIVARAKKDAPHADLQGYGGLLLIQMDEAIATAPHSARFVQTESGFVPADR